MSDEDAAWTRLQDAVARLETAFSQTNLALVDRDELAALEGRIRSLRDENERLARELAGMQADHSALKTATDGVSGRLDNAINQLKTALEG